MSDSLQHQIALTLVPQVGAVTAKNLVSYCGSAEAVFRTPRRNLLKIPGIGPSLADNLAASEPLFRAEREMKVMEQYGIVPLFYTSNQYPFRLKQCYDCPAMLYFKGSAFGFLDADRIIGIVGTRQPSDYGRSMCEEIIAGLQPYNVVIVSGLAFGIDVTAHKMANSVGIPNIGVLGHGLGTIYPSQHRSVAQHMTAHGGLLTEYTSDTKPDREHFPMRNRIIAGLCDGIIVMETAASGGSMITAELASQYARDIFAVPGRAHDPKSAGCNLLIRNASAQLIESAEDLANGMCWEEAGRKRPVQVQLFPELSPSETGLLDLIRAKPEIAIDELAAGAQLPNGELASNLLSLEFKGIIRTLPGKRYIVSGF
jgi:DNA processing protein